MSTSKTLRRYWVCKTHLCNQPALGYESFYVELLNADDVARIVTELRYLVDKYKEGKTRPVTIDWSRAQHLLALLEETP